MKKIASLLLSAAVAASVASSAQARNSFVHKFTQHTQKAVAAVYMARAKNGDYAWGYARGADADAQAKANCEKNRDNRNIKARCRRLAFGGAQCFALYVRPSREKKVRFALTKGATKKSAERIAKQKCGKQCRREIADCAAGE